jgi:hypothetical protein
MPAPRQNRPLAPLYSFDKPTTRADVKPGWITPAAETPLDPALAPNTDIDTTFDWDAIVMGQPIPEVVPALLGLQAIVAERRIARAQAKIERLEKEEDVRQFVGRSILLGKGYMKPNEPLRPTTSRERRAAKKLERKMVGKKSRHQSANNISDPYLKENPNPNIQIFVRDFEQASKQLSRPESRNNNRNARHYRRLTRQIGRRDEDFADVVTQPHRQAQKLIKRRDKLVAKTSALDTAKLIRDQKRRERREAIKESFDVAKEKIATGSRKAVIATRSKAKSSYNTTKRVTGNAARTTKRKVASGSKQAMAIPREKAKSSYKTAKKVAGNTKQRVKDKREARKNK